MRLAVSVLSPPGYPHSQAFTEVASTLHWALLALGHDSVLSTRLDNLRRRHIVFGANLLPGFPQALAPDTVLVNLEQVSEDNAWMSPAYLELLRRHRVWDYCEANVAALARWGLRADLLPVGYMPQLSRIALAPDPDIDVLFYGSINERRRRLLQAVEDAGIRLHAVFNVYGAARDALIARSKLVLNLHHYPACLFELVRVSYLLANRVCVVAERGQDDALEQPFRTAVRFVAYEGLVAACRELLADEAARKSQAERGFDCFSRCDPRPALAALVQELED